MPKKSSPRPRKQPLIPQTVVHPDAAGIDLASEVHYVAVPTGRDPQPVRSFGTTTDQLCVLADWLQQCGIRTVAMEATGVYWPHSRGSGRKTLNFARSKIHVARTLRRTVAVPHRWIAEQLNGHAGGRSRQCGSFQLTFYGLTLSDRPSRIGRIRGSSGRKLVLDPIRGTVPALASHRLGHRRCD